MRLETLPAVSTVISDVLLTEPTFSDDAAIDVDAWIQDAIAYYADSRDDVDDVVVSDDVDDVVVTRKRKRAIDADAHVIVAFGKATVTYWRRAAGAKRGAAKRRAKRDAAIAAKQQAAQLEEQARLAAMRAAWSCYFDDCKCDQCDVVSQQSIDEHVARVAMRKHNDRIVYEQLMRKDRNDTLRARRIDHDRLSDRIADMAILTGNDPAQAIAREQSHISRSLHRAQRADRMAKLHRAKQHYAMTAGSAFSARVVAEHRIQRETMSVRERARIGEVQQNTALAVAYQDWYDANIRRVSADDAPAPVIQPTVKYERRFTALERGYDALLLLDDDDSSDVSDTLDSVDVASAMTDRLESRVQVSAFVRWHYDAIKTSASYRSAFMPA